MNPSTQATFEPPSTVVQPAGSGEGREGAPSKQTHPTPEKMKGRWSWRHIVGWVLAYVVFFLVLAMGSLSWWLHDEMHGCLPMLDGEVKVKGLGQRVRVKRDAQGIPTLRAENREDLAFATGFVHAQDRFFQMDLLRRHAGGELAELLGKDLVELDRQARVHGLREVAEKVVQRLAPSERRHVQAYVRGVEAGRQSLRRIPWEYRLLGTRPRAWSAEDTVLVGLSIFRLLQDGTFDWEAAYDKIHGTLPPRLAHFLTPTGTPWDAPLKGEAYSVPPIPPPELVNLRQRFPGVNALPHPRRDIPGAPRAEENGNRTSPGSNNWVVSKRCTSSGAAMVANDMHLPLSIPNIWYRIAFTWPDAETGEVHRVYGITLPGTPAMVVGSNTHIAWGFTNSEGDWSDLVVLEAGQKPDTYRTPKGDRSYKVRKEVIKVRGGKSETMHVRTTLWGPVYRHDYQGRPLALHWVAHDPEALDFRLMHLEKVRTAKQALDLMPTVGIPGMNFLVGDAQGHIGWTLAGRIPRRVGLRSSANAKPVPFLGRRPVSWAGNEDPLTRVKEANLPGWRGWLGPEEYPRVYDPPGGRLWTANNRVVAGKDLARVGYGCYDLGARASQIRDGLQARQKFTEQDMLDLMLDDRALFLSSWQKLLLEVLSEQAIQSSPNPSAATPARVPERGTSAGARAGRSTARAKRALLRQAVEQWGGKAAVDSAGYRIVRSFRKRVHRLVLTPLLRVRQRGRKAEGEGPVHPVAQGRVYARMDLAEMPETVEGSVWKLVTEKPKHLLPRRYKRWEDLLLAAVDEIVRDLKKRGGSVEAGLEDYQWGQYNTVAFAHPFHGALPGLDWLLSLEVARKPLPGDAHMPRVQVRSHGASQRMVVAPGHEDKGIFHMPGGQSGHPLSPHYRDGHEAWEQGKPTPFLPGKPRHVLVLIPGE